MNKHQAVQNFFITGLPSKFAGNNATESYMMVSFFPLLLFICSLQTGFLEATSVVSQKAQGICQVSYIGDLGFHIGIMIQMQLNAF